MARRKTKRRTGRRRSSRMGAVKVDNKKVMTALGVTGGLLLTAFANKKVSEMAKPIDPMILSGIEIVAGLFGPQFLGKGNPLVEGIGYGVAGAGALNLLEGTGILSGMESMVVNGWTSNGTRQLMNGLPGKVVNGAGKGDSLADALSVINGVHASQYDEMAA